MRYPLAIKRRGFKLKTSFFYFFPIALLSFLISYELLSQYQFGDQRHYHNFYELIKGVTFSEVGPIARNTINGSEPISLLVLWAGSNLGFEKNIWISFLNALLVAGLFALLRRHNTPWLIIFLLITNFYLIVLMTGAERLKISYIILIWAFLASGKLRLFLGFLSPFAHFQSFILLQSVFFASISHTVQRVLSRHLLSKDSLAYIIILFLIGAGIFFYLQDDILRKSIGYATSRDISLLELINVAILSGVGAVACKEKFRFLFAMLPLVMAVAILGGQRVNMIAFTVALGLFLVERKLTHPLVILLLVYFSVKSIPFVLNIYEYGNGFGGPLW
jgi:hypothetical protein